MLICVVSGHMCQTAAPPLRPSPVPMQAVSRGNTSPRSSARRKLQETSLLCRPVGQPHRARLLHGSTTRCTVIYNTNVHLWVPRKALYKMKVLLLLLFVFCSTRSHLIRAVSFCVYCLLFTVCSFSSSACCAAVTELVLDDVTAHHVVQVVSIHPNTLHYYCTTGLDTLNLGTVSCQLVTQLCSLRKMGSTY